jgi:hypothetical protein
MTSPWGSHFGPEKKRPLYFRAPKCPTQLCLVRQLERERLDLLKELRIRADHSGQGRVLYFDQLSWNKIETWVRAQRRLLGSATPCASPHPPFFPTFLLCPPPFNRDDRATPCTFNGLWLHSRMAVFSKRTIVFLLWIKLHAVLWRVFRSETCAVKFDLFAWFIWPLAQKAIQPFIN